MDNKFKETFIKMLKMGYITGNILLFSDDYDNCSEYLKTLVNNILKHTDEVHPAGPPLNVSIFSFYYTEPFCDEIIIDKYFQNPEITDIIKQQWWDLPDELKYIIEGKDLSAYNKFLIIIGFDTI